MTKLQNNAIGAVGEHQTISRLLLLDYQAAITNLSIENAAKTDILCRRNDGRIAAIQVKTTSKDSFLTGISHKQFYDEHGNIDLAKGRKFLESKIVGPWVMVQIKNGSGFPSFKFFVLSRSQIIEMIYSNEKWYLTGHNRTAPLKGSGMICIYATWLQGYGIPATNRHIQWTNPFETKNFEEAWHNLWID